MYATTGSLTTRAVPNVHVALRPEVAGQAVSRPLTTSRRIVKAAARKQQLRKAPADRDAKVAVAVPAEEEVTVREEKLDACGTRLHITVSAQKCKQAYKKVMDDFRREANVAGYRKGKAPDSALLAQVGGMGPVANSALSEVLEPAVAAAMKPYEGVAVPESERIEQNADELESLFSTDNGFTFSIRFDAVPRLSWKTPYRELEVSVEAGDAADDAAEVERRLLSLRKGQAKLKVVADRGLQPGDLAIVDFGASRVDTGEELIGATRQSMRLDTDDADTTFLPGIVAIITGMRAGEEREAPLTFPTDEAFQPAMLRGVEAKIKIKMTELFTYDMPELSDEWASTILTGGSLEAVRQRLLETLQAERAAEQRERIADAFTSVIGKAVDCEIPESLLNELGSQQYSTTLNQLLAKGQLNFESVQQLATPELAQQFVASRRDELLELQRSLLGFEDIALQEGLKPSESEIEAEFAMAAQQFTEQRQEYDAERLREQVFETVQANKVMAWLNDNCKINYLPPQKA